MFYRNEVTATRSLTLRGWKFLPFSTCDLDLDPKNFIYEVDPYSLETTECAK